MREVLLRYFPVAIASVWVVWLLGILSAGAGANVFGNEQFDFELAGQFGDAFGSLSGLMATLAAAGAWYAVSLQHTQLEQEEDARKKDDRLRREQAFEQNFFQLLEHLANLVRSTDIETFGSGGKTFVGKDAFRKLLSDLRQTMSRMVVSKSRSPEEAYDAFYKAYQDDIGHYFRVLYHTCNYVYSNSDVDRSFYMKLLFGQLSNSELILLGYNCALGAGRRRFKPIVEEFGGLTNIGFSDRVPAEEKLLRERLAPSALPPRQGPPDGGVQPPADETS